MCSSLNIFLYSQVKRSHLNFEIISFNMLLIGLITNIVLLTFECLPKDTCRRRDEQVKTDTQSLEREIFFLYVTIRTVRLNMSSRKRPTPFICTIIQLCISFSCAIADALSALIERFIRFEISTIVLVNQTYSEVLQLYSLDGTMILVTRDKLLF